LKNLKFILLNQVRASTVGAIQRKAFTTQMKEKPDAYLTRHFAGDGGQCIDGDAGVIQAFANK